MKLIGFLLVLFVGMSGVSYGQTDQDSKHIVSDSTISQIVNYFDQQYKLNNSKGVLVYADEVSNELLNLNRHPTERIIRYHRMMAYSAFRLNLYNKAFSYTETAYLHVKNDENTAAESLVNLQLELARYAEYSTSQYEVINYYDQVLLNNDLSTDSLKVLQESIFNSYSFYLNKMQDYPNELRVLNKYLEFYNVHFDSKSIQYQKILYWKGIALINIKRYSAGISVLESLLNEDFGKSPQQRLKYSTEESSELFIWVWLAHSYSKLLDYPNAERAYQKAIELYLNKNEYRSAAVLVNKFISLLRENKNCNRCIEVYENNKFLNQNLSQKEQLNVLYQYVNCLADCERYQDALKICDSVIHGSTDCTIENRCFQFIPLKASLFTQGSNHISAYNIYDSLYTHSSIHLLRENQPDEFIAFSNNYMWCALRMGFRQKHKQLNQELFNFSVKHYKGDKYMLSRVYNSYAAGLFEDYSLDSALINYEIALKLADSAKNKIMMARIYNNMSEPYAEMGMYQTSIQLVDSALQIQKGIALNDNYYTYLNNKGVYLNKSGLFSESIKCYQRRIGYSERTFGSQSDSYLLGRHNLALVYKKVGSFEKASSILLDCYEKNIIKYGSEYNEACAMNLRAMTSLFGVDQENALKFNLRVKEIYDSNLYEKEQPPVTFGQ